MLICGVVVSLIASCVVTRGFKPWLGQANDLYDLFLLLRQYAHSIMEEEQRLVGLESG